VLFINAGFPVSRVKTQMGSIPPRTLVFLSIIISAVAMVGGEVLISTYLFRATQAQVGVQMEMFPNLFIAFQEPFISAFTLRLLGIMFFTVFIIITSFKALSPYQLLLLRAQKFGGGTAHKNSNREVDFVISTYKGLMSELQEKKEELEKLYNMEKKENEELSSYNESIINSISAALLSFDYDRKLIKINPAALNLLDLGETELEEDVSAVLAHFSELANVVVSGLETGAEVLRNEMSLKIGNRDACVGLSTSIMRDEFGKTSGLTMLISDLTRIKAIEKEMRLKENLASIGEVSAGIAHQFRNPLGSIMGYARIVEKRDDKQTENIQKMIAEIQRMDVLVGEFLEFTKPAKFKKCSMGLAENINTAVLVLQDREKEIRVICNTPEDFTIDGDPALLREVWLNIMDNSVESIGEEDGWIKIMLEAEKNSRKDSVRVVFSDSGMGISEEIKNEIFKPFFSAKEGGTGLGLALSQRIILAHNGFIDTVKVQNKNSVAVILPLRTPQS